LLMKDKSNKLHSFLANRMHSSIGAEAYGVSESNDRHVHVSHIQQPPRVLLIFIIDLQPSDV